MRRAIAQPLTYHGWFAQMSSRAKKQRQTEPQVGLGTQSAQRAARVSRAEVRIGGFDLYACSDGGGHDNAADGCEAVYQLSPAVTYVL